MQGVVKAYDPRLDAGSILDEASFTEIDIARGALEASIFRFLRQGQRINFDLDENGRAINLRFGSEVDMETPLDAPNGDAESP